MNGNSWREWGEVGGLPGCQQGREEERGERYTEQGLLFYFDPISFLLFILKNIIINVFYF